jgi:hypothetical protein
MYTMILNNSTGSDFFECDKPKAKRPNIKRSRSVWTMYHSELADMRGQWYRFTVSAIENNLNYIIFAVLVGTLLSAK